MVERMFRASKARLPSEPLVLFEKTIGAPHPDTGLRPRPAVEVGRPGSGIAPPPRMRGVTEEIARPPEFDARKALRDYLDRAPGVAKSELFVPFPTAPPEIQDRDDGDLETAVPPARAPDTDIPDVDAEYDFLKTLKHGRKSTRRATVQLCTRLRIDPEACAAWCDEILEKRICSLDDMDDLISHCEGDVELEELRANIRRIVETAGIEIVDQNTSSDETLWDVRSEVTSEELTESVIGALNRTTPLPGTRRPVLTRPDELRLVARMTKAKRNLHAGILSRGDVIEAILREIDNAFKGNRKPKSVFLKSIYPNHPEHPETVEAVSAVKALRAWHDGDPAKRGKQRSKPLAALRKLDLSMPVLAEIAGTLSPERAAPFKELVSQFESTVVELKLGHLPYARRFSSRNVEDGEHPEDVFQVVYTGLHSAIWRFAPERNKRFTIYCRYWMKQALSRWRTDEGSAIRVPADRHEKLRWIDQVAENVIPRKTNGGSGTDGDFAEELGLPLDFVAHLRQVPRIAEYPENAEQWDSLISETKDEADVVEQEDIKRVIGNLLDELPKRQSEVLRMRYGIDRDGEMTLEEVGNQMGLTRERVRQIEAKSLERLSLPVRKRRLEKFLGIR